MKHRHNNSNELLDLVLVGVCTVALAVLFVYLGGLAMGWWSL